MRPYYDVLKDLIMKGTQTLRDLENRIAYGVADGRLTPEEADELKALASAQSAPPDLPTESDVAVRLDTVEATVTLLVERVAALETDGTGDAGDGDEGDTPTGPQPPAGVEAWVAGVAYMYGEIVWHADKVWVSQEGNNRFEPGVAGWAWKAVA